MQVIFFNKKAKKFFNSIEEPLKTRADQSLHLLEEYENELRMPYSKSLGGGLFELRIIGSTHIRFLYAFHDRDAWILHGFIKKTNKIPKAEISYAQKQLKLLLQ